MGTGREGEHLKSRKHGLLLSLFHVQHQSGQIPYFFLLLQAILLANLKRLPPPVFYRLRKEELSAISGPNEFAEFYNRLKQIKEFHRKHPNEVRLCVCVCV